MIRRVLAVIRRVLRGASHELGDATEWSSHAEQFRPPFSEEGSIFVDDPKAGWGHPDEGADERAAEEGRTIPD